MLQLIKWFRKNWEEFATLFLLLFIPLYPKLPLFDIVQTWVYVRLDDFIVTIAALGLLAKLYRRRYLPDTPLTIPILCYWWVGLVSVAWSLVFVGPRLLGYFPQLVLLHYLRRIEYMIVFFLAAISMGSDKAVRRYLLVFVITVFLVSLYGLGQRYLRLPAFLTMNEEFAKGTPLYLSSSSRLTSTFAGHYDLAMYLSFAITIFVSIFLNLRNWAAKLTVGAVSALGVLVLFFTQSRISLFALGLGVLLVLWWQNKKWWILPIFVLGVVVLPFIPELSDRFVKTFRARPVIYDIRAGIPLGAAKVLEDGAVTIEESASPALENLPIGSGFIRLPNYQRVPLIASFSLGALHQLPDYPFRDSDEKPSLGEELQMAMERGQLYLSLTRPLATTSGEVASIKGRFFLDRALLYDISFTTRFQGQWPRAWEAFSRNVLLGSGYSVLSLAADSDYLRALGETGFLGFASFFFILLIFLLYARIAVKDALPLVRGLTIGVSAGLVGLFMTATMLDVFEASKLAYVFWLTLGTNVAALGITYKKRFHLGEEAERIFTHPAVFILMLALLVPLVYANVAKIYFVADDFTWLRWAGSTGFADFVKYFTDATGFFYRPLTKLYFFLATLVFWFKPEGYHGVNLFLHFGSTAFVYLIVRRLINTKSAVLTSLFFLVLALHHENVIWISGVSSLAGSFFALFSLYLWMSKKITTSLLSLAVSMLFYEEMMFVPFVHVAYAWIYFSKRTRVLSLLTLLLMPLYFLIRANAGAIQPSGSYGINLLALPFNVVGNSLGYIAMTLFGPLVVPWYENMRVFLRSAQPVAVLLLSIGFVGFIIFPKKVKPSPHSIFFLLFSVFSLIPVLGLGNIAERYGYLSSVGISFLFVMFVLAVFRKSKSIAIFIFIFFLGLNYWQLRTVLKQWESAGKKSERIFYELRRMYYPLEPNTKFVVAGVPTRIGRAWVFPVGLADGAYQVFYEPTMKLDVVGTAEDALSVKGAKALIIVDDKENPVRELYE